MAGTFSARINAFGNGCDSRARSHAGDGRCDGYVVFHVEHFVKICKETSTGTTCDVQSPRNTRPSSDVRNHTTTRLVKHESLVLNVLAVAGIVQRVADGGMANEHARLREKF